MIDHIWTVVCSRVVIDQETNNVSIQNAIEQLNIPAEPIPEGVIPVQLDLVTFCVRSDPDTPCRGELRLSFRTPSNRVLATFERAIDLSEHERHRNRMRFNGLAAEESGRHYFDVDLRNEGGTEWHHVSAVPLTIEFEPPEEEQAEDEPEQED